MINRSKYIDILKNPRKLHIPEDSKFFFSEKEALEYQKTIEGQSKIDSWSFYLDDAIDEELEETKLNAENRIKQIELEQIREFGKILINDSQKETIMKFSRYKTVYSVSFITNKTYEEDELEHTDYGTYDHEINGATPVVDKSKLAIKKEGEFMENGVKITAILNENLNIDSERYMRVFYKKDGVGHGFSIKPISTSNLERQFDYVNSLIQ